METTENLILENDFEKLSELGDVAKNRLQAFAAGFNSVTGGKKRSDGRALECTEDTYIVIAPATANTVADKYIDVTVNYQYKGEL